MEHRKVKMGEVRKKDDKKPLTACLLAPNNCGTLRLFKNSLLTHMT